MPSCEQGGFGPQLVQHQALGAAPKILRIAIVLWRSETEAEQGFKNGLRDLGSTAQYIVLNAEQEPNRLAELLRQELLPQRGTFGTTVSTQTKKLIEEKVPQLFNMVADPVGSGLVMDLHAPGGNINGEKWGRSRMAFSLKHSYVCSSFATIIPL